MYALYNYKHNVQNLRLRFQYDLLEERKGGGTLRTVELAVLLIYNTISTMSVKSKGNYYYFVAPFVALLLESYF